MYVFHSASWVSSLEAGLSELCLPVATDTAEAADLAPFFWSILIDPFFSFDGYVLNWLQLGGLGDIWKKINTDTDARDMSS